MNIQNNISLKSLNTFNIDCNASYFLETNNVNDLNLIDFNNYKSWYVLGEGSNTLFVNNYSGLIIHLINKGIDIIKENENHVFLKVQAGEIWDDFVSKTVTMNLFGAENLSLIPGTVGAAPVQNIGAYGAEVKDIIEEVNGINIHTKEKISYNNEDCKFSYRNSIFKNKLKGKFIITDVVFRLKKHESFNLDYGNISEEIQKYDKINLKNIRDCIIEIRNSKLPDYKKTGNAGSFFKNPILEKDEFLNLKKQFPDLPEYPMGNKIKTAAGKLIDDCGLKGYEKGNCAIHHKQALVIINTGNATGKEIFEFSDEIIEKIYTKYRILLEREVGVIR